jgi:glutamate dehydrogenase
LLSAILKAPVDLLYNGGIGTYVKASSETHAEVGDRANDALRINGRDLRCKVVAEGGNLGFTQRGRIEARWPAVRINTDASTTRLGWIRRTTRSTSRSCWRYFPSALQQGYGEHMQRHRLRREIIATAVTNSMVNRMGATFLLRMQEDTGRNSAQIAKAYSIAREVLDSRAMWAGIDALDSQVEETVQVDALLAIWSLLRGMTRWLLNRPGDRFDIAEAVMRFKPSLDQLRSGLGKVLSTTELTELNDATARWSAAGVPELLSAQLASISYLHSALDIIEVASASGQSVLEVAKVYSILGESLTLKWLQQRIDELPVEGRWHALARGSMRDELQQQQGALVAQVLRQGEGDTTSRVQRWMEQGGDTLKFTLSMFADMRALRSMDYATASVAVRRLAQLVIAGER